MERFTVTTNAQNTLQHFQEGAPLPMPSGTHANIQLHGSP